MAVPIEQIIPGAVFRFKTADRRVVSLSKPVGSGFDVKWKYADGKKRAGRLGGAQWVHYFRQDAIHQLPNHPQTPPPKTERKPVGGLQERVEALEQKLQLRLPWSTFTRQISEVSGDPANWVLGLGEMQMPKTFFIAPTMADCLDLAERYVNGIENPGLHVAASFCGDSLRREDFVDEVSLEGGPQ